MLDWQLALRAQKNLASPHFFPQAHSSQAYLSGFRRSTEVEEEEEGVGEKKNRGSRKKVVRARVRTVFSSHADSNSPRRGGSLTQ